MKIKHKNIIFGLILLSVFGFLQTFNFIEVGEQLGIISSVPNVEGWKTYDDVVYSHNVTYLNEGNILANWTHHDVQMVGNDSNQVITEDFPKDHKDKRLSLDEWWKIASNGVYPKKKKFTSASEIFKINLPEDTILTPFGGSMVYHPEKIKLKSIVFNGRNGAMNFINPMFDLNSNRNKAVETIPKNSKSGSDSILNLEINPSATDNDYRTIFEFEKNHFLTINGDDKSMKQKKVMISWNKPKNYFLIKLTDAASIYPAYNWEEWKDKVHFRFVNNIKIEYDAYMVNEDSHYSLENDIFIDEKNNNYHSLTQKNISNFGITSSNHYEQYNEEIYFDYWDKPPFFTNENTYQDVADALISQKMIVSRDEIPWDNVEITFLEPPGDNNLETQETEIPMSQHLSNSEIYFRLTTHKGTSHGITIDESSTSREDNLDFIIPFMNVKISKKSMNFDKTYENLFIFDNSNLNDPTDNEISNLKWKWSDGWTLYSNTPIEIKIKPNEMLELNDGINSGLIDRNVEICDSQDFVDKNGYPKNQTFGNKKISFVNNNNDTFSFKYHYMVNNEELNDVIVNTKDQTNWLKDQLRILESPLATANKGYLPEVFRTNVTQSDFSVKAKDRYKSFEYNALTGEWIDKTVEYPEDKVISKEGIYGFSSTDDNGLVSFEVVERLNKDATISADAKTTPFDDKSDRYLKDRAAAIKHGLSKFDSLNPHDIRKIESKTRFGDGFDLGTIIIKNELLQEETESHLSGKKFKILREALEEIIYSTLNDDYNINKEDIKIQWTLNGESKNIDEKVVNFNDILSFSITPSYSWNTKGKYESGEFKSKTTEDISSLVLNNEELVKVTNNFEQGNKFSKLKYDLNKNIYEQWNLTEKDIKISWNLNDDDIVVLGTELDYSITVLDPKWKGTNQGSFESQTFFNLKNLEKDMNNIAIQAITLNHIGETFISVKTLLEEEINNQLISFGYDINKIKIDWSYDKKYSPEGEIKDGTVIQKNSIIYYRISSRSPSNKDLYRNSCSNKIEYGVQPVPPNTTWKNILLYISLILIIIILAIILIIYVLRKNKSSKKKLNNKVKDNELVLENNSYISSLIQENNDKKEEEYFDENQTNQDDYNEEEYFNENQDSYNEEYYDENQDSYNEEYYDENQDDYYEEEYFDDYNEEYFDDYNEEYYE